jgi:hypothetical protein
MRRRWACLLAVGVAAAWLCGCTAGNKLMVHQKADVSLAGYTDILVAVDSTLTEKDVQKDIDELGVRAIQAIKTQGYSSVQFKAGDVAPAPGTLLVKVTVTKIRRVSKLGRFAAGIFAGRASIVADVAISEPAASKTLGTYTVSGESGASGVAGGTEDAIAKAGEAIGALFKKEAAQTGK